MRPIQIAVVFAMLFAVSVRGIGAADFSRPTDVVSMSEAHLFADLVYDADYGEEKLKKLLPGWEVKGREDESGLAYAVYHRASDGQRVLAFRGTNVSSFSQGFKDWSTNILSSTLLSVVIPVHEQYDRALQIAQVAIRANQASGTHRPLVFTGDSKGGGHVEYVCAMLKSFGFAFDSAPLGELLLARIPEAHQAWANRGGIVRPELKSDPVSKLDVFPGSKHLGLEIQLEVPQAYQEAYYRALGKAGVVGQALNLEFPYLSHVERTLFTQAIKDYESKSTSSPRPVVSITPSWWVSRVAATDRPGALATANAIARTGRPVQSVLLVGQGNEIEELAIGLRAVFPNVKLDRTSLIVGIKSDEFKGRLPLEQLIMRMDDAKLILSGLDTAAQNAELWNMLPPNAKNVPKVTSWAKNIAALTVAVHEDIKRWEGNDRVIWTSKTVETVYELAVTAALKHPMDAGSFSFRIRVA